MRERAFRKENHRRIAALLHALDGALLLKSRCFFGGGTSIALRFGEYRESRDVDFLCSDRDGFRAVRESVRPDSLGRLARKPLSLARDVRADRDGIRTFVEIGGEKIKLELILEARIELSGALDRRLGVPRLDEECLAAEKMLANADRGLDESTFSRDLVDLAFLAVHVTPPALEAALARAERAYGTAVRRGLERSLRAVARRGRLAECARALGIEDTKTLKRGLAAVWRLVRAR